MVHRNRCARRIIPALAGNTVHARSAEWTAGDHPRSRGEYFGGGAVVDVGEGSSPLSRGILGRGGRPRTGERIIPALAGNTPRPAQADPRRRDHPRSRGEYGASEGFDTIEDGSSPLSRGIPLLKILGLGAARIIPALAGNTTFPSRARTATTDHPRSRGEYGQVMIFVTLRFGSSPLSRGILNASRHRCCHSGSSPLSRGIRKVAVRNPAGEGIIPALAGNTFWLHHHEIIGADHPRSRGEYILNPAGSLRASGSSPLSRGILHTRRLPWRLDRIIPALAGNTPGDMYKRRRKPDHPRSRGEYADSGQGCGPSWGSSPLSRGIHPQTIERAAGQRIIPALAGNTYSAFELTTYTGDHPRSRGEYTHNDGPQTFYYGSSPLSRGILGAGCELSVQGGIIPALAGNT